MRAMKLQRSRTGFKIFEYLLCYNTAGQRNTKRMCPAFGRLEDRCGLGCVGAIRLALLGLLYVLRLCLPFSFLQIVSVGDIKFLGY